MSRLSSFRDHAAKMAEAEHHPDCPHVAAKKPSHLIPRLDENGEIYAFGIDLSALAWQPPSCDGSCITEADRAAWRRLAAEVDAYNRWGSVDEC